MSVNIETLIDSSPEHGHLVVQNASAYAIFQTSMPREKMNWLGRPWYTYGRIIANGNRLVRNEPKGPLLPGSSGTFDVQIRQNIFIVPDEEVDKVIAEVSRTTRSKIQPLPGLPAERLFRTLSGRRIDGTVFGAYGTYTENGGLMLVDAQGGYETGLVSSQGIPVASEQATALPTVAIQPLSVESNS